MGLGAIVVIGAEFGGYRLSVSQAQASELESLLAAPLPCVDVLGRSVTERMVERFVRSGIDVVSVLVAEELALASPTFSTSFENLTVQVVSDLSSAVIQKCKDFSRSGIEQAFIVSANLYTETDLLDMFYFHREAQQTATRAHDGDGTLDLWVVDCAEACAGNLHNFLAEAEGPAAAYFIRDYVNRLNHPRDLRRLVSDSLRGRCAMRPSGTELKPGIWVDEGADIHRRARIVAPAYIGRNTQVNEDTLITRCSNIERGCCIDYGTVIENSSILPNTHIGIWLDVCYAVVNGNKLMSLSRNVTLEVADRSILRSNGSSRHEAKDSILDLNYGAQPIASELNQLEEEELKEVKNEPRTSETWQFRANPIQG